MAIVTRHCLYCEAADCDAQMEQLGGSVSGLRSDAKTEGWRIIRSQDYCPDCVADGEWSQRGDAKIEKRK